MSETMNRHYNDEPKRKAEGVLLTRSQCGWQIDWAEIYGTRIVDNTGRLVVANAYNNEIAEQIVTEHNQHAALVKQRDALAAALRFLLKDYEQTYHDLTDGQFEFSGTAIRQAQHALATVEQGHESQAGGGSGSER